VLNRSEHNTLNLSAISMCFLDALNARPELPTRWVRMTWPRHSDLAGANRHSGSPAADQCRCLRALVQTNRPGWRLKRWPETRSWMAPCRTGSAAMAKLRTFCVSVGTGYPLVGLDGVDANFQPQGEGIKWRYVLMRSLNSTQVWNGVCLILSKMWHFYGQHDLGDTT